MLRVMFLDDEPAVLAVLRRCVEPICRGWQIEFFSSARAAIEAVETQRFDVVVSDLRMAEMDGIEFLDEVMRRSPCSLRIILSGLGIEQLRILAGDTAHHCLPKPCDVRRLTSTIERLAAAANRFGDTRSAPPAGTMLGAPESFSRHVEAIAALGSSHQPGPQATA